jgi:outer membrane protein assembly factor BamB
MSHRYRSITISALLVLLTLLPADADNWPHWRGPEMNGHSRETAVPLKWSATENVAWKVPLPQSGMSTPVVWGDRVFVTQALDRGGRQRALLCFSRRDGRELWRGVVEYTGEEESTYNAEPHWCSASPTTDGQRVVASFGSAGLYCWDMKGKLLWKRELGRCDQIWGTAASPVLWQNIVLHNFGPGERTFLIALNKQDGTELWRQAEPGMFGKSQDEWQGSWSTPVVRKRGGGFEVLISWPNTLKSYDPATGRLLWRCDGLGRLVYTSPLVSNEVVVVMSGFMGPAMAVKLGGTGDVTDSHRLWRQEKAPQRIGSGVVVGDTVYQLNENGVWTVIELSTGKLISNERAGEVRVWSSITYAGGRLYCVNQQGEVLVFSAETSPRLLSRNAMGERAQASIAVSDGDIFVRTYGHLWCIRAQ